MYAKLIEYGSLTSPIYHPSDTAGETNARPVVLVISVKSSVSEVTSIVVAARVA